MPPTPASTRRSRDRSRVGKLADITVLSKDIMTIPEDQIPTARMLYTIVGGKVQYSAPPPAASQD